MVDNRLIIGVVGISAVTILQCIAWCTGHNGTVFALTSAIIGGVCGYFFGWEKNVKKSLKEYLDVKEEI